MDPRKSEAWRRFGGYVADLRESYGLSQERVAEMLNEVTTRRRVYIQGEVSAFEHAHRLFPEVVRDYIRAFDLDPWHVVALLFEDEPIEPAAHSTFDEVIDNDPTLSDEYKTHLKKQYPICQKATAMDRRHWGGGGGGIAPKGGASLVLATLSLVAAELTVDEALRTMRFSD